MKLFYSIFSGTIYEVYETEVKNLDDGQIPLKRKPSDSCRICYGRGYSHFERDKGIYPLCKCMSKCFPDDYVPGQVKLLPKIP